MTDRVRGWLRVLTGRDLRRRIVALELRTLRIVDQLKHDK